MEHNLTYTDAFIALVGAEVALFVIAAYVTVPMQVWMLLLVVFTVHGIFSHAHE